MNLDTIATIKARLGGDWYDTWWVAIFNWIHYPQDFWGEINYGWSEMYEEPLKYEPINREEFLKSFINSNPYYNEKYYL